MFGVVDAQGREAVAEELLAVSQALQDPEIAGVLGPRTPTAFKRLIATMHPSPHVEAFLRIMLENRRLDVLADAAAALRSCLRAQGKTIGRSNGRSAPLRGMQAALERKLAKLTGKTWRSQSMSMKDCGAGLIIRVDGKVIDGSLAHSLQRAKEQLLR